MNSCPICFESVLKVNTASPDVCDHIFCLTCLTKWSKHESFCPIDRKRFKKIIRLDSKKPIEIKRHKRKKASVLYDITAFCEICKTSDSGDTLLLCDCCDLGYHCACLTPQLPSVPPGRWFCPTCVSIDEKLKEKKGDTKVPKPISRNRKLKKRSHPRPATSNLFSESSNSSISTPSMPDESSSELKIRPKKFRSCSSRNIKSMDSSKGRKRNSNDNIPHSQSQSNGIIVSEQDYQILNYEKKLFILPEISLSPKRKREVVSDGCKTSVRKRTNSKFSVFEKSETSSSRPKCRRNLDFSEVNGSYSEVSCDVSDMQASSGDCSISSNISKTESCELNQLHVKRTDGQASSISNAIASGRLKTKFDESFPLSTVDELRNGDFKPNPVHNLTKETERKRHSEEVGQPLSDTKCRIDDSESEQSPEQSSEVPSACERDKSFLFPGPDELKCSESDSQPSALHGLSLNEMKVNESDVVENPLVDFESRNSQYALKAKMSLQEELQKMEQEKWKYFKPLKKLKSISFNPKPRENLLDFPKRQTVEEKMKFDLGCNVFNIEEYKEGVRKGTWRPENIVILERNKDIASDKHRLKILMEKQLGASCTLNVFQVPDSQNDFVADNKCQAYMTSFNPFESKSGCGKFENNLLQAALHVDLEELSMPEWPA